MSAFPAIGIDIGTSSTKVVHVDAVSCALQSMRYVPLRGSWRWPSVVSVPKMGGDVCVFAEPGEGVAAARVRRNLKLALLLPPGHSEHQVIEDATGWQPDALYASMVAFALATALAGRRERSGFLVYLGAPLRDRGGSEVTMRFARAAHAAREHVGALSEGDLERRCVPREVVEMLAGSLARPAPADFRAEDWVVAESHAAVSASELMLDALGGTNCVIDMGAGTTDIGWFSVADGRLSYFAGDSIDVAGEALDDGIRRMIERVCGRRVSRAELWAAKAGTAQGGPLRGIGWELPADDLERVCRSHADHVVPRILASASGIGPGRVRFVLVGGATLFQSLRGSIEEAVHAARRNSEFWTIPAVCVPSSDPSVTESPDTPLWVAMGLSRGLRASESYATPVQVPDEVIVPAQPWREVRCSCDGTNDDCARCCGRGSIEVGMRPEEVVLDPFEDRRGWRQCHDCNRLIAVELLDEHRRHVHRLSGQDRPVINVGAAVADVGATVCGWIRDRMGGAPPLVAQWLMLADAETLDPARVRDAMRRLRPPDGALDERFAEVQATRALRAIVLHRVGWVEDARRECGAVRDPAVLGYLADLGIMP
jgi:hypothetical protein